MPLRHRVSVAVAERRPSRRSGADEGFVMSSPLALMSAAAVLMAGVAFFVTDPATPDGDQAVLVTAPAPTEAPVVLDPTTVEKEKKKTPPPVQRGEVYVSVYNNSNITGLAGTTASRIGGAGWQVTGSDNWYGTIPATTIYFPPRFQDAAELLSKDLGITRVLPAVDPMSMDRLTVILTSDFA
ncbi:LytR C-terminal domain-containing protein [Nocardioides sp. HDW12B]|uniref:LytR C-terminal domain-containing protein n=1 Tax=Nocardioides sp. HDW12B TaxID=2714939 RepID=UPI001F0EF7EB|nr:LytR C-terminal domain-containing protein [Nocardioides sp. HDW12B]